MMGARKGRVLVSRLLLDIGGNAIGDGHSER